MSRYRIMGMLLLMTLCFQAIAQDKASLLTALGQGDMDAISAYIGDDVEICILDDQNLYTKSEGLEVLNSFYAQYPAKSFSTKHVGDNKKSSSTYTIGQLNTVNGSFRIFVFTDQTADKLILEELRISKE